MSGEVVATARRSVAHPYWCGLLSAENVEAVAERMRRMLDGKAYTFVAANSYSEESDRFSSIDVRASCRLVKPPRLTIEDDWCSIGFLDRSYSWSLHTNAKTEQDARAGSKLSRVQLSFNSSSHCGESLTVDHYAPAGYRLQWIVVVEESDADDGSAVGVGCTQRETG